MDDPATLFVFDMPGFGEFDLRGLPLLERKALLARVLPKAGALRYSDHVPSRGKELFEQVKSRGLEGLVAKRANAPYRAGRSGDSQPRIARTSAACVSNGIGARWNARAVRQAAGTCAGPGETASCDGQPSRWMTRRIAPS